MELPSIYQCIIVDNDEIDRLTVHAYVRKYPEFRVQGVYSSAQELLQDVDINSIDILFADIDMPDLSGLKLRSQMMQIPVCIFISAFPDYAAESFEVEALDFLVKPLKAERFDACVNRIGKYFEIRKKAGLFELSLGGDTIFIKSGHDQIKLKLHDILYLEALKDYTRIITSTKKYSVLSSLGNLLNEPAFKSFLRIHRSFAIQPHYIERITSQDVVIQNYSLPIGRSYKDVLTGLK